MKLMTAPLIHTDTLTRTLYANDASMYEEGPQGVAFPRTENDVITLLALARSRSMPVTARAAGTSLAGQATGAGLIMDVSRHMDGIVQLDPGQAVARVQPGVIRDTLNRAAAPFGLHFAPDTATTNRCMIGGMIGNNSAGLYSVKYGSTRDHIRRIRAVLSDGSTATFGPLRPEEVAQKKKAATTEGRIYREMTSILDQHADLIRRSYPHASIIRRNTGYALDRLLEMDPFTPGGRPFNLAELLCGSEGTLALTLEADVGLKPLPRNRILVIPHFGSLNAAVEAAVLAVRRGAAAVELLDDIVLTAALENPEQSRNRFFIAGSPSALLIVELHGDEPGALADAAQSLSDELQTAASAYAAPVMNAPDEIARVWDLRKAGLGLLMGGWSDKKTPEFMEDTAVRVEDLPAYVRDVQALAARYKTRCVYYGHASVGELHLRPELNMGTPEGLDTMKRMAADVADLVRTYRGSLSGEHGDGRVRAPHLERVFGPGMMMVLETVKRIWDPDGLLNPGKIVRAEPMDAHLRIGTSAASADIPTVFHWRDQKGFDHAIGRCNGAGVCRKLADSGGTMCPSYMATRDEKDSTRGRANLFRQLFRGQHAEAFGSDDLKAALDLCLSCKACKTECPANVDMARMKAEFLHGWHQRHGTTRGERLFAFPERIWSAGSRVSGLANLLNRSRLVKALLYKLYGLHPKRTLPSLAAETLYEWSRKRVPGTVTGSPVLILNDCFMNYMEPHIGIAMVTVLEALGCRVEVTPPTSSGRTCLSMGFLDEAKATATRLVRDLHGRLGDELVVIGQEPSELLTVRDEFLDLVDDADLPAAHAVASRAYLFEEYLLAHADSWPAHSTAAGEAVHVHGHCHVKSMTGGAPLMELLRRVGYKPVEVEAGCCGMAGSFGYESDHYELSMRIGELRLFPALRKLPNDALLCAQGFSCRHQIADGTGRQAYHPAELIAAVWRNT